MIEVRAGPLKEFGPTCQSDRDSSIRGPNLAVPNRISSAAFATQSYGKTRVAPYLLPGTRIANATAGLYALMAAYRTLNRRRTGMNLTPIGDRLIVRRQESEGKSKGGIVLPDSAKAKPQRGKVLAVGPGKLQKDG